MKNVLVLLSSSFPYGRGESFLAAEIPWLESAFDEIVLISNDTTSPASHPLAGRAATLRVPYALSGLEKVASLMGVLSPPVWRELAQVRRRGRTRVGPRVLRTILVSWYKAHKFARRIRRLGSARPDARLHAYSYWANDMAVAVAVARRKGWVHRAWARAHGWDVYADREGVGFLPFRDFLARHLDHLFFVSEDGRRFFESWTGRSDYPSVDVMPLGTAGGAVTPLARPRPIVLVSCSSLVRIKRVDRLARALALLRAPVRWVHLGDGPLRPDIESICRDLPDDVDVELRGQVPHDEVLATYRALRPTLFVNVSEGEGVPVSMMEAMSLGIPVMGPDVGGVSEIVQDGKNGVLLAPEPTPEGIARALEAVFALPDAAFAVLCENALLTWRERYSAERNFGDFVARVGAVGEGSE